MRYSCISPTSRRSRRGRSHGHHAGHGRYDRADHGHHGPEFTFRTHRRIWRNNQSTFTCAIFSSAAARVSRSSSSPSASAEFCSAVHGIDPDRCFPAVLYFSGEFFQTTFAQQFCVRSSTSGMVSFMVRSMLRSRRRHGSQRTAAHGQHGPHDRYDHTVNVRLRIHRDIVVNYQADRSTSRPRAATSVAIRMSRRPLSVVPVSAHAAPGSCHRSARAVVAVTLKGFCHFQSRVFGRTKIIAASKSSASRKRTSASFYAYPRQSSSSG